MARPTGQAPEEIPPDIEWVIVDDTDTQGSLTSSTDSGAHFVPESIDETGPCPRQVNQRGCGSIEECDAAVTESEECAQRHGGECWSQSRNPSPISEEEWPSLPARVVDNTELDMHLGPLGRPGHIDPIMELVVLTSLLNMINNSLCAELERDIEGGWVGKAETDEDEKLRCGLEFWLDSGWAQDEYCECIII